MHAFQITLVVAFYAVLANTLFGVAASLLGALRFHGKRTLNALIDLPLAVSVRWWSAFRWSSSTAA